MSETSVSPSASFRTINLKLLVITLVFLAIASPTAFLWFRYQKQRTARSFLDRATVLEQEEKWREAAEAVLRYLQVHPLDADQHTRMAENYARAATTPQDYQRLANILFDTLGVAPDRDDLRLKLADSLYRTYQYVDAERESYKLLSPYYGAGAKELPEGEAMSDSLRDAHKIYAKALASQMRPGDAQVGPTVAQWLERALRLDPADAEIATMTAELYRTTPEAFTETTGVATDRADAAMDQLVAAAPQSGAARLARFRYRQRFGPAPSRDDLNAALEIDKTDPEARMILASVINESGTPEELEATAADLRTLIETLPNVAEIYVTLFQTHWKLGQRPAGIEVLKRGRTAVGKDNLPLGFTLLLAYIETEQLDEATEVLADVKAALVAQGPRMDVRARIPIDHRLTVLEANLQMLKNDYRTAVANLQSVLASSDEHPELRNSLTTLRANELIVDALGKLGRYDEASSYATRLASGGTTSLTQKLYAAQSLLQGGQPDQAIAALEPLGDEVAASEDATILICQAHFASQLRRPSESRVWAEFQVKVSNGRTRFPDSWQLAVLEANQLVTLGTPEAKARALQILSGFATNARAQTEFWQAATFSFLALGDEQLAEQAFSQYKQTAPADARRILTEADYWVRKQDFEQAERVLADATKSLRGEEQVEVVRRRFRIAAQQGKLPELQALLAEQAARNAITADMLADATEFALSAGNLALAEQWEQQLAALPNTDSYAVRFLRARRQLIALKQDPRAFDLREIERLVRELRTERPQWFAATALAAECALASGDKMRAITDYEAAVELGDTRISTIESLYTLLYEAKRFDDAHQYASRLTMADGSTYRLGTRELATAIGDSRLSEALELAKSGLEQFANDPVRYIWLADIHARMEQLNEAEGVLRTALDKFPNQLGVWNAWLNLLARTKTREEIAAVVDTLPASLDATMRRMIRARAFELSGNLSQAIKELEAAVADAPNDVALRLRYGRFLMQTDAPKAQEQFEAVLKLDPRNAEAKQQMAVMLAVSGNGEAWARANALLQGQAGSGSTGVAANRLRVALLARRSGDPTSRLNDLKTAQQILEEQATKIGWQAVDRMLLSRILEQQAAISDSWQTLEKAREQLQTLATENNLILANHLGYAEFLLRHANTGIGESDTSGGRPDFRAMYFQAAESHIPLLEKIARATLPEPQTVPLVLAYRVRVLALQDRSEETKKVIDEFAAAQSSKSTTDAQRANDYRTVGSLYTSVADYASAETWYRKLVKIDPASVNLLLQALAQQGKTREAVDLCIRQANGAKTPAVASILAQILAIPGSQASDFADAEEIIRSVVGENRDNVNLLMSMAVLAVSRGRTAESTKIFRRILEIAPTNTAALNNLATLLAEDPAALEEALTLIDRAIRIDGRTVSFMDTRASILIAMDRFADAVPHLEEATASLDVDPRSLLHLAFAYHKTGKQDSARQAYRLAKKAGLRTAILTDSDRQQVSALDAFTATGQ